jgi:probable phosphoglycerate mutase
LLGRVLTGRMPGVGLSEAGREQAERLAGALAGPAIAAVVSSPQERAVQTGAPIAARLGIELTRDDAFDEIDFGAWSGRAFAALDGDPQWDAWNRLRSCAICPGGETMLQAQARAVAGLLALRAALPDAEVVIVSHQDVIKALLCHALGASLDMLPRLAIDPASRSVLVLDQAEVRVQALNA